jgi:hypothetical protein
LARAGIKVRCWSVLSPGERAKSLGAARTLYRAWLDAGFRRLQLDGIFQDIALKNGRVQFLPTGEMPCHIHFHGRMSLLMDEPVFDSLRPWSR